jgi:hypothetical protein
MEASGIGITVPVIPVPSLTHPARSPAGSTPGRAARLLRLSAVLPALAATDASSSFLATITSSSSSSSSSGGSSLLGGSELLSTHAARLVGELGEGLETPVQLAYLVALLGFLAVGAFLVVRQVLIRRELEEAAKVLGERIRAGEASSEDYFELGVILLRKKLFTQVGSMHVCLWKEGRGACFGCGAEMARG